MSYKLLEPEDFLISAEAITTSAWSGNVTQLTSFYTSSVQYSSTAGDFYVNVYNEDPSGSTAEVQFTIGYGHINGSGSVLFTSSSTTSTQSPSSVVYGQMRTLLLGDEEASFIFDAGSGNSYTPDDIYVITLDRSRYKEKLAPGSLELVLNNNVRLKDNSSITSTVSFTDAGRVYEVLENGTVGYSNSGSFGKFFPDVGIIILNPAAVGTGTAVDPAVAQGNTDNENPKKLFDELYSFKVQSQETVSSNFVFTRARNSEFNYTTNPSYITGSGEIRHEELINSPETYITTVGLYNDNQDLLAVAKLSRPLLKNSTKEALIRIKLDY